MSDREPSDPPRTEDPDASPEPGSGGGARGTERPAGAGPGDPTGPDGSEVPGDPEQGQEVRAVLLDMGGVILDLGEAGGLPWGDLDRRGRAALLDRLREAGGDEDRRVETEDLDRWLFGPWRRGHARRVRTGREEPWGPHLARLQRHAGVRIPRGGLLETWARPYLDGLRAITGAREALSRLVAADLHLALVSNVPMPGSLYSRVLEREGLARFFEKLLFSYDQRERKPGPALVLRALDAVRVEAEAAIMVGDRRSRDVAAGRAADVRTVRVRTVRGERPDDEGPEPDAEIASIVELPELLGV